MFDVQAEPAAEDEESDSGSDADAATSTATKAPRPRSHRRKVVVKVEEQPKEDEAALAAAAGLNPTLLLCLQVLKGLMRRREAQAAFNEPVDPVERDFPQYHYVVKQPMDLGTVRKRLLSGYYNPGAVPADGDAPMDPGST